MADAPVTPFRASCMGGDAGRSPNTAVEQITGSPSLATAAHRERWADEGRKQCRALGPDRCLPVCGSASVERPAGAVTSVAGRSGRSGPRITFDPEPAAAIMPRTTTCPPAGSATGRGGIGPQWLSVVSYDLGRTFSPKSARAHRSAERHLSTFGGGGAETRRDESATRDDAAQLGSSTDPDSRCSHRPDRGVRLQERRGRRAGSASNLQ